MADELIAYLNGEFLPMSECKVSLSDRGFGGGGVYDVERTFDGKIFRLDAHMDRFYRSLKYVRINPRMSKEEMAEITQEVVRRNEHLRGDGDWSVNQTVTRGSPLSNATGRISAVLDDVPPTVFINVYSPPFARYAHLHEVGVHVIFPRTRNYHHSALDSKVKHHSRLNATMAMLEVVDADPEAWPVLLDHDGFIAEGTGSNFWIVDNGVLRTPTDKNILQGMSRDTVMILARTWGFQWWKRTSRSSMHTTPMRPLSRAPVTPCSRSPESTGAPWTYPCPAPWSGNCWLPGAKWSVWTSSARPEHRRGLGSRARPLASED